MSRTSVALLFAVVLAAALAYVYVKSRWPKTIRERHDRLNQVAGK